MTVTHWPLITGLTVLSHWVSGLRTVSPEISDSVTVSIENNVQKTLDNALFKTFFQLKITFCQTEVQVPAKSSCMHLSLYGAWHKNLQSTKVVIIVIISAKKGHHFITGLCPTVDFFLLWSMGEAYASPISTLTGCKRLASSNFLWKWRVSCPTRTAYSTFTHCIWTAKRNVGHLTRYRNILKLSLFQNHSVSAGVGSVRHGGHVVRHFKRN